MNQTIELPESVKHTFRFFAYWLFIMAGWTLIIKFILPVSYAIYAGQPVTTYIMWDFWWVIHIALGYFLLNYQYWVRYFTLVVSLAEIIIIVVKFIDYYLHPITTFWKINWFINKVFVLALFISLLYYLMRRTTKQRLQVRGI